MSGDQTLQPERKHPAHNPLMQVGFRASIVFLTVCTKDRKPILSRPEAHDLLIKSWKKASHWSVGRYVIMPDHVHLFCTPATQPSEPIRSWTKYWKSIVSSSWPWRDDQPIWQQDGWDTQLRQGESYARKWQYVRANPVRAGLVATAEEWKFQGELNVLTWHDA